MTGNIRTLKSSNACSSLTDPFLNSSSGSGSSLTSPGTSVEYTTLQRSSTHARRGNGTLNWAPVTHGTPWRMPFILKRRRTDLARGSSYVDDMSLHL